jgi:hypothetical protein
VLVKEGAVGALYLFENIFVCAVVVIDSAKKAI